MYDSVTNIRMYSCGIGRWKSSLECAVAGSRICIPTNIQAWVLYARESHAEAKSAGGHRVQSSASASARDAEDPPDGTPSRARHHHHGPSKARIPSGATIKLSGSTLRQYKCIFHTNAARKTSSVTCSVLSCWGHRVQCSASAAARDAEDPDSTPQPPR